MSASWQQILHNSDLLVDRVYEGGRSGNASDDPLPHLVRVSNQGGFRYKGNKVQPKLIALTSTAKDQDWPDFLDKENGIFTYYGDNKKPGYGLHETPRFGNLLLKDMFDRSHGAKEDRRLVPPVFIFSNTGSWRDVEFMGLAVPGAQNLNSNQDLVAVWKLKNGKRFQNYQAKFTVLDTHQIQKSWIQDIEQGNPLSENCPEAWRAWVEKKVFCPLKAPRALEHRVKEEQLPEDDFGRMIILEIYNHFKNSPVHFEACAAKIAELMLDGIVSLDLTRPVKDGGRDAIGKYRLGFGPSAVLVDFALEAKCYDLSNSVGVRELSRLISRLRHRQFGILVTTSYVATQAYQEIKEDEHPIIIISARDIVNLLRAASITTKDELLKWLASPKV